MSPFPKPFFTGDPKHYFMWRSDFMRIVEPKIGIDPYLLKCCLGGNALELVKYIPKWEQIWERLDEFYGDKRKFIKLLFDEIWSYEDRINSEGELAKFIGLVINAWEQLCFIDCMSEIDNLFVWRRIELCLPFHVRKLWVHESRGNTNANFNSFILFLKSERWCLEYDLVPEWQTLDSIFVTKYSTEVNTARDYCSDEKLYKDVHNNQRGDGCPRLLSKEVEELTCPIHNVKGHALLTCKRFIKLNQHRKLQTLKRLGACYICFGRHLRRDCPHPVVCQELNTYNQKCLGWHNSSIHFAFTPPITQEVADVRASEVNYFSEKQLMTPLVRNEEALLNVDLQLDKTSCSDVVAPVLFETGSSESPDMENASDVANEFGCNKEFGCLLNELETSDECCSEPNIKGSLSSSLEKVSHDIAIEGGDDVCEGVSTGVDGNHKNNQSFHEFSVGDGTGESDCLSGSVKSCAIDSLMCANYAAGNCTYSCKAGD